jgi:hypothetical protein
MKKILMTGAALSALVGPAYAGPILDSAMETGMTWTADSSAVVDGVETYTGLTVSRINRSITIENLQLAQRGGKVFAEFQGMEIFPGSNEATSVKEGAFDISARVFDVGLAGIEKAFMEDPYSPGAMDRVCNEISVPFSATFEGMSAYGDPEVTLDVDMFKVDYDVIDPKGDCIMDADVSVSGVSMGGPDGTGVLIEEIAADMYWSLLNARAPSDLSATYTSKLSILNTTFEIIGEEQVSIDEILSEGSLQAGSLEALIGAGYFEAYSKLLSTGVNEGSPDFTDISVPAIWNAVREIVSDGTFKVSGAEITGNALQSLFPSEFLAKGRDLDLLIAYDQDAEDILIDMDVKSSELIDAELSLGFVLDELDPSLAEMGPSAVMMVGPVSLSSIDVSLNDGDLGRIIGGQLGFDPYAMAEPTVSSMLGAVKGEIIADWLEAARNGGASFSAKPDTPMPIMEAFAGFMGDWKRFGERLNASAK